MLSNYQLKIADLHNILIGHVKKLLPNFFDREKDVVYYENLQLYLRLGLKRKQMHRILELSQSQCLKPYAVFNTKRNRSRKNEGKDGKALYKLMSNAVWGKTMKILRNLIDVKLVSNKKDYLKRISKPSCKFRKNI